MFAVAILYCVGLTKILRILVRTGILYAVPCFHRKECFENSTTTMLKKLKKEEEKTIVTRFGPELCLDDSFKLQLTMS